MIGGLIEEQEVRLLESDHGKRHPGLLPTRESIDGLQGLVPRKPEPPQLCTQRGFVRGGVLRLHKLQRGHLQVELVDVVLRKRGDADLSVANHSPRDGLQLPAHDVQEGRLPRAVGSNQSQAGVVVQADVDVPEQRPGLGPRVPKGDVDDLQVWRGHRLGLGQRELKVGVLHRGGDEFQAGDGLHAALRHLRPFGVVPPAVHEGLHVLALLLLRIQAAGLVLQVLTAGALEGVVVPPVVGQPEVMQVDDVRGDAVEEGAAVRDHDQGLLPVQQGVLQPQHSVEVQVVGGLIQEQNVWANEQGTGQADSHPPPPAEGAGGLVQHFCAEA
eukprot:RCo029247